MKSKRVSFQFNNGRRDRRYPLPSLVVTIDGNEYTTMNWSLGGFLITGFDGALKNGETFVGMLGPAGQTPIFEFSAKVVRVGETGPAELAAQFTDLGEHGMTVLERLLTRRLFRG